MSVAEITSNRVKMAVDRDATPSLAPEARTPADRPADDRATAPPLVPEVRAPARRRVPIIPFMITLGTVMLAGLLGWAMWGVYMAAPWTRDATVRAHIVMMAPEVAGRIVELHIIDNKYVRKGDLLMVIDPTNYKIAVSQAEAAVQQVQASVQNIEAQMNVQQAQIRASQSQLELAQAALVFAKQQAARYEALAKTGTGTVQNAQQFTSQCISRKPRCRPRWKITIWRSVKSRR